MKVKEQRRCDKCGELFLPRSSRQHYCRKKIIKKCLVCGCEFETTCGPDNQLTCSKPECKRESATVCEPEERVCKRCGDTFVTTKRKQLYCNCEKTKTCPICGKEFTYICGTNVNQTCGNVHCQAAFIKQARVAKVSKETRICKWCGKEFHPREVRDIYCYDTHYKTCVICGKKFEFNPKLYIAKEFNTCSKECKGKLMSRNHDYVKGAETFKRKFREKYGVENPGQLEEVQTKMKETSLEKYGSEYYTQTDEYKERVKKTNLEKYGVEHHLQAAEVIDKRIKTNLKKYKTRNVFQSEKIKEKIKKTNLEKYGAEYISQVLEIRSTQSRNSKHISNLEVRICQLLDNYAIDYIQHHVIASGKLIHEFDFYLPEYKLLIDADGLYYHSYLEDPNGKQVRDDYDEVRIALVPKDHRFYLIVEGQEDKQIKELVNQLEAIKGNLSDFDSILFEWCRSIDFPYPNYTEDRMKSDYSHLVQYTNNEYVPQCRLGQSILKNFHKSIYDARVGKSISPKEGWYDDNKLRQVIRNRLIYQNNVDPSKILSGFNISKICPCVSTFNPVLAKYLINKYLSDYNTIFDPFSGFSGRLIGTASTGKSYIGQDLNHNAVAESNEIIDFLELDKDKYRVTQQDILQSEGEFECLLTCPPYSTKEIYNEETEFKSCDEWIQECLNRFKCKRYVFVVDETHLFKQNIVEEIKSASHLSTVTEYVIVIDR